jgi:SAM-dependent methyltransferase
MVIVSALPRWFTDHSEGHAEWYIQRFRTMAAAGADLAGEARLIDALVQPHSRILDAGCGPGRVAAELHARGHTVVGVDVDPELIEAAEVDHSGPRWVVADLSDFALDDAPFDAAVVAGNVMAFVAPGTEPHVLARVAAHLRPDGVLVVGFGTDRGYLLSDFDSHCASAGLIREHRFATWDLRPWHPEAGFAVTVLRRPN